MILNCYIIDDEEHAVELLSKYIGKTPGLRLIGSQTDPLEALDVISNPALQPDILFLDVDMPQISGMELSNMLSPLIQIIFVTGYPKYAINAFEQNAVDYLLKPVTYERFLQSVMKAKEKFRSVKSATDTAQADDYFFVQTDVKRNFIRIQYKDILYIESSLNYVKIYTEGNTENPLRTYFTLKELLDKLPSDMFMQIHKAFIVNTQKIKALNMNEITLEQNSKITIGATYQKEVSKFIHTMLFKSNRNHE